MDNNKHSNIATGEEDAFGITFNKGYFMNINGYRISVQFGYGNYVDADVRYGRQPIVEEFADDEGHIMFNIAQRFNVWQSRLAEVMIDTPDGVEPFGCDDGILGDQVMGWCTAECVAELIGALAGAGTWNFEEPSKPKDIREELANIYFKHSQTHAK